MTRTKLWTANYSTWLASDTAFELSNALASFAVPLMALMLTDDPIQAGIIGATGLAARVLTTLIGGVLADRHSRIALMLIGACFGVVLGAVFTVLTVTGWLTYLALLLLNLGFAVRSGLFGMATQAALKDIVSGEALGRAQASNQGRDAIITLAAAPVGGLLLGWGAGALASAMTLCQALAGLTAARLRGRVRGSATPANQRDGFLTDLAAGFRWVFSRADLRGTLMVVTLINLGFASAMTTVVYALQQGGSTPATIGLVTGGLGVGTVLGASLAPALVTRVPAGLLGVGGILLVSIGVLVMPLVTHPVLIATVMAIAIVGAPALNAGLLGYFMVATPGQLMGRASSALSVFAMGAMPLAPLVAGVGLAYLGRTGTLVVSAAVCLAAVILAVCTPGLRTIPAEGAWVTHAAAQAKEPIPSAVEAVR